MKPTNAIQSTLEPLYEEQLISLDEGLLGQYQQQIIRLYKRVFGYSSWNEGYRCAAGCGAKFALAQTPQNLECCGKPVVDFYSDPEVREMISGVMQQTQYRLLLLLREENVIGFSWGWFDSLADLNRQKLKLDDTQVADLIEKIQDLLGDMPRVFYYQSETGVDPEFRGKGLSQSLINGVEQSLPRQTVILQRTSRNSPMFNIRLKNGYSVVLDYNDADRRVLFCKQVGNISDSNFNNL